MIVTNLTGIVMMIIVVSGYKIKQFVTKMNALWTGLCIIAMVVLPYVRTGKYGTILIQEEIAIVNVWWIFLVVKEIFYKAIRKKKSPIKLNINILLWIAMTLCMFFSVAFTNIWPIFYLGMFGCFYLTEYSKKDFEDLLNAMIDGSILAFILMQAVACFLRPYDSLRYVMLYSDCNSTALYYLIIYIMLLAKLHIFVVTKSRIWKKTVCVLLQGCVLSFLFMTGGRTVWGITMMIMFFYGVVVIKRIWNKNWLTVFVSGIILFCVTAAMLVPMYELVRWIPTSVPARLWYQEEVEPGQFETEVLIGESKYSEKYVKLDELVGWLYRRFIRSFELNSEYISRGNIYMTTSTIAVTNGLVVEATIPEISNKFRDSSLNARIEIFNMFFEELNWWGNNSSGMKYTHAHNLYLQIAYMYGIPAGILLIVLAFTLTIFQYREIKRYRHNPYAIIPFMICLAFFGVGIMGVVWVPGRLIMFLLFFIQYPFKQRLSVIEE